MNVKILNCEELGEEVSFGFMEHQSLRPQVYFFTVIEITMFILILITVNIRSLRR